MRSGDRAAAFGAGERAHDPRRGDDDARLVERLRRREDGAAEALVATYGERVYRLAVRITGNGPDAEEVVQDALWSAIRRIDTFRGEAAFGSWMFRITANAAYQKRRGRRADRREVEWDERAARESRSGRDAQADLDWSPRLRDPAVQSELSSVLQAAIDELPDSHRVAFLLRDVDGLSNSEVARTVQIGLAAVKSRVHRARLFLRARLAGYLEHAPAAPTREGTLAAGARRSVRRTEGVAAAPREGDAARGLAMPAQAASGPHGIVWSMAPARQASLVEAPRSA